MPILAEAQRSQGMDTEIETEPSVSIQFWLQRLSAIAMNIEDNLAAGKDRCLQLFNLFLVNSGLKKKRRKIINGLVYSVE